MTLEEARSTLLGGGKTVDLLEAVGTIESDSRSALSDLILGLPHPELIAEQAAFALYRRTGRPMPADGAQISTDPEEWLVWLLRNRTGDAQERLRILLATSFAAASRIHPSVATMLVRLVDETTKEAAHANVATPTGAATT